MARARARSDAPPPRRPPQRSQGSPILIIFLVFFILISLTLGIFLYLAQDKVNAAETIAKAADDKSKKAASDLADVQKYFDIKTRQWVDTGLVNPQEIVELQELENRFGPDGGPLPKGFIKVKEMVEGGAGGKGLIGTPKADVAATYFKGLITQLQGQLAEAEKNRVKAETDYKETREKFETYQKEWNAPRFEKDWKANADKLEAINAEKLNEKQKALEKAFADIDAVKKDMEQRITDEKAKAAAERRVIEARITEEVEKINKFRQELVEKHERTRTVVIPDDAPKVIRAEPNGEVVFIDIGQGDRVTPDLTFLVYERGPGGKANLNPKAAVRVISVVGKGVSQARVTRVAKPEAGRNRKDGTPATPDEDEYWITNPRDFYKARNPVVPGDLLNNPAWSRNETKHVFLLGVFDLDGDGNDDIDTFRRLLREIGAEVDGYLDPTNEYELKGRIDYQTDYLIRGSMPFSSGKGVGKLKENGDKIEAEAVKKGIRIEPLQRFLMQMGYTGIRVPTARPTTGAAAAPAANGDKKEAAPMKDDADEKKPKKEIKEEVEKK